MSQRGALSKHLSSVSIRTPLFYRSIEESDEDGQRLCRPLRRLYLEEVKRDQAKAREPYCSSVAGARSKWMEQQRLFGSRPEEGLVCQPSYKTEELP